MPKPIILRFSVGEMPHRILIVPPRSGHTGLTIEHQWTNALGETAWAPGSNPAQRLSDINVMVAILADAVRKLREDGGEIEIPDLPTP